MKMVAILSGIGLSALMAATTVEAAPPKCSTTVQAEAVISDAATGNQLVVDVAQSVPTDPDNCIPNYCVASSDESDDVKVAVGAGISEAYARLKAAGNDNAAIVILNDACSQYCDEITLTALAASQSTSVGRLCETIIGRVGGVGGAAPSVLIIDGGTGGGGGSASRN